MRFALDHVVIAVADLARAIEDYRALGFTVEPGGRHPGRTSHNALVVFEDGAYLELIAWPEPGPAERWYNVQARHGEGILDFAFIPEDVPQAVAQARERGLAMDGPLDGGRVRPDGRELEWQTGRQATYDLPFLCGDVTPRELRVPGGAARKHANGAVGIATVSVAVRDPQESVQRYAALLGSAPAIGPTVLPGLGLRVAVLRVGACDIVFMAPLPGDRPSGTLAAELRERLAGRGEGPFGIAIRTDAAQASGTLDPARAHRALVELVPQQV